MEAKIINTQSGISDFIVYLYTCLKLLLSGFVCVRGIFQMILANLGMLYLQM